MSGNSTKIEISFCPGISTVFHSNKYLCLQRLHALKFKVAPEKKGGSILTLPETNSSHLKMDGWNTIVSFWGPAYFQGLLLLVSGRVIFILFLFTRFFIGCFLSLHCLAIPCPVSLGNSWSSHPSAPMPPEKELKNHIASQSIEPRKKNSYSPLNPGWLIGILMSWYITIPI